MYNAIVPSNIEEVINDYDKIKLPRFVLYSNLIELLEGLIW